MLDDLAVGDEVVTAGGLYGTITELEDDSVRLEIAPELTVRVAKRAIAAVLPPELEEAEAVDGEGEPEAAELEGQETSARVP